VDTEDPTLTGDPRGVLDDVQERVFASVSDEASIRLSASEIFVTRGENEILTSAGVHARNSGTSLSMEFVLLTGDGTEEVESHGSYEVRRLSDFNVEGLVTRHATRARDSLRGELPASRTGPVVISQGAFTPLFNPLQFATSGHAIYRQISPLALGEPILGPREVTGDALTLCSDPTLPFATNSRPFDGDGLGLSKVNVIENGAFQRIVADKRFADYLSIPATGGWHNEVVGAGSALMADLLSPADGPVYHVVEFSWLNPDAVRGDFSTEIRLGYEISAEGTRVIRGGSLAGNVYDALASAHLARETALEGSYLGPTAIRFDALQVTGT
jgi:predicted Zn-dependent protease